METGVTQCLDVRRVLVGLDGTREAACRELNFLTAVDLRTEDPAMKWVLRGVALMTTID